jgi:hypothetical protein
VPVTKRARVRLPTANLDVGDSFFVPTLDINEYNDEINKSAKRAGFEVYYIVGIDKTLGCFGIRVFRAK